MTEQQSGISGQELPIKTLSRAVTEGVSEMVEASKAKSLAGMMRELAGASDDPFAGLKHLKEAGLDLGTITSVQKEAADTYRVMAAEERSIRQEREIAAKEAEGRARQAETDVTRLLIEQIMNKSDSEIKELRRTLEQKNNSGGDFADPIRQSINEVVAELVKTSVSKIVQPVQQHKTVEEELFERMTFSDRLSEYFEKRLESRRPNGGSLRDQAMNGGTVNLELWKVLLEDERERERYAREERAAVERTANVNAIANGIKENLGDILRALSEVMSMKRTESVQPTAAAAPPIVGEEPVPVVKQSQAERVNITRYEI